MNILDQILSLETENEVIEFKEKKGIPITFKGHYYGRFGESTTPLGIEKIERIRKQSAYIDWSIKTIADATINDLDELAILKAKVNYQSKNPRLFEEIKNWDNKTFLQKTQLIIDNKITNTAILLLGKSSAAHFISPAIAHITWILKDKNNTEKDYQHFSCPFIITIDEILAKIRILKYRFLKKNSLFTEEVDTYNVQDIREAISNCIAHQDYTLASRINIVEFEDNKLMFINAGQFLPGDINNVLFTEDPPLVYRNNFLVQTMFKFNMIDTIGSGIKRIFYNQLKKYFPMPDYDISNNIVKMTIAGKIMNENYTEILMNNPDLKIEEIIILDKVQKKLPILDSEAKKLKEKKLIEGRKPNYYIAENIALQTNLLNNYIKNKAFDNNYYKKLIIEYLQINKKITNKQELRDLLFEKFSDILKYKQKEYKISKLLTELKNSHLIVNNGTDKNPKWELK